MQLFHMLVLKYGERHSVKEAKLPRLYLEGLGDLVGML